MSHYPVSSRLFGTRYTGLPRKTRIDFDVHVTSMVQCAVSAVLMFYHFNNPHWQNRLNDPVNSLLGFTPFGGMVISVTAGYFVWDLLVCLTHFDLFGIGFSFHAIAAMYAFCCGFVPYCQPWAAAFLSFELSTPFVNMNWFASRMPAGTFSDKFVMINGLLLIVVFFFVRIVWGIYAVVQLTHDMRASLDQVSIFTPAAILAMNFALNSLNVFWFYKMVRIAIKKIRGQSSTRKAVKVAEKIE
ncbi:hypothetical protein KGF57_000400 [Candida theae]|uniref:TLC domain-containing protein n=1 Tax=Candida theae TaxID=1198502 RepID=A0AAD5BJ82_9ASCO|nr:uncharacterized protein KGF57_000400 [Candida theae]KAI5967457.1 hypothetical protein KGF57_000400 [Candida theae]